MSLAQLVGKGAVVVDPSHPDLILLNSNLVPNCLLLLLNENPHVSPRLDLVFLPVIYTFFQRIAHILEDKLDATEAKVATLAK